MNYYYCTSCDSPYDPTESHYCQERSSAGGPLGRTKNPPVQTSAHDLLRSLVEDIYTQVGGAKAAQYGMPGDPGASSAAMEDFGLPAWFGQVYRIREKLGRAGAIIRRQLAGAEPTERDLTQLDEDLFDIAGLAVIARMNLRQ